MDKYYLWYDKNTKTIYPSTNRDFDLESPDIYKVDGEVIFFNSLQEQILFINQNFKEEVIPHKYRLTDWDQLKKKTL